MCETKQPSIALHGARLYTKVSLKLTSKDTEKLKRRETGEDGKMGLTPIPTPLGVICQTGKEGKQHQNHKCHLTISAALATWTATLTSDSSTTPTVAY